MRHFNLEGPVCAHEHYCVPPLERVDLDEILQLIDWKKYFVLHAPRQTGKTTVLEALADRLNSDGSTAASISTSSRRKRIEAMSVRRWQRSWRN